MSHLHRYLARMALFLVVVGILAAATFTVWASAFLANPLLNGVIVGVAALGAAYIVRQTTRLRTEIEWVRAVQRDRRAALEMDEPPLIGALARMMADRSGNASTLALSPIAIRSVLDGIATRLDETREISRYFVSLLIFLGLLGTFWGLLRTVGSVGAVVDSLTLGGEPAAMFQSLKAGLQAPLAGMGTAFSASLFGLAGSLVLGFLDLQTGQAQNRFFIDLEDWLSVSARLTTRAGEGDGSGAGAAPLYVQSLLEQSAENIEQLRATLVSAEEQRRGNETGMLTALRAIEQSLARIHTELAQGRVQSVTEIRGDIKLLTRTLAAVAGAETKTDG